MFPIVKRVVCLNRVDDCCVVILFDDPENANGKLLLESKKEMRARGIPSPDEDDAIALCFLGT